MYDNCIKLVSTFSQELILSWKTIVDICLIEKNLNGDFRTGGYFCSLHNKNS